MLLCQFAEKNRRAPMLGAILGGLALITPLADAQVPDPRTNPGGYAAWCSQQFGGTGRVFNNASGYGCTGAGSATPGGAAGQILAPAANAAGQAIGEAIGRAIRGQPNSSNANPNAIGAEEADEIRELEALEREEQAARQARISGDALNQNPETTTAPAQSAADQLCGVANQQEGCIGQFKPNESKPNTKPPQIANAARLTPKSGQKANCDQIVGFSVPEQGNPVSLDCRKSVTELSDRVAPILREADEIAKGRPLTKDSRAQYCRALAKQLDATYQLARRAALASNVYEIYENVHDVRERQNENAVPPAAFTHIRPEKLASDCGVEPRTLAALTAPTDSHYRAAVYKDNGNPKKVFLVFRGTTEGLKDWIEGNAPQGIGIGSSYYTRAIKLARLLKACSGAKGWELEFVGHSLGGGMADAAGVVTRVTTTSFNPAGVHPKTLPNGTDIKSAPRYVTDYVVQREPLNARQDNVEMAGREIRAVEAGLQGASPVGAIAVEAGLQHQAATDPRAQQILSALAEAKVPRAIGRRVTLEPLAEDAASRNPVHLHQMVSVVGAISRQWAERYRDYSQASCAVNTQ